MSSFREQSEASYERDADSNSEYERKREKRLKERALSFLTHSKRAEDVEPAERYLERMNEIKEKLVLFTRAQILDKEGWQGMNEDPNYPYIRFGYHKADEDDLDNITAKNINRTNPELWKLKRSIQNSYRNSLPESDPDKVAFGVLDRLTVKLNGPSIEIHPDYFGHGEVFLEELRKYLSEEDLTFLRNEYRYTAQDLERTLRAVADQIATDSEGRIVKNFLQQDNSSPERITPAP